MARSPRHCGGLTSSFLMTPRALTRAPISLPRRSRPTSAGSGNTPSSASCASLVSGRPPGRAAAAFTGPGGGRAVDRLTPARRAGADRRDPSLRRRKPTRHNAAGATSSPAVLPPASSSRWRSLVSPIGSAALPSSSGRLPTSSASAPKRRSPQRRKPPTVWSSTWRSGSATTGIPASLVKDILDRARALAGAAHQIRASDARAQAQRGRRPHETADCCWRSATRQARSPQPSRPGKS